MEIEEVLSLLEKEYGEPERAGRDPVSELIITILSQNTSDVNSGRAFAELASTFPSWEEMIDADTDEIEAAIRSGGLSRIKAERIKQALNEILKSAGSLDLGFLSDLELAEAKAWLRGLPGVGPKTAGCVLLFSLGMPALPVDTHVYRVSRRLGLIDSRASPEKAHQILEGLVPPREVYRFHMSMVEHGRRVCRARHPRCGECVFNEVCPSGLGGGE